MMPAREEADRVVEMSGSEPITFQPRWPPARERRPGEALPVGTWAPT